ncbi:hypothetical protein ACQ4PT_036653 [Festuca glaucescens]
MVRLGSWMACPLRPAEVGAGHAGTARHARPLSLSGLTPQSPLAEQGKGVVRALRRASGKRSATLERARQVRGRREGSHTGRRFGDDLSTGNSKCVGSSDYDADFGLSHVDSFGNSLSSSDKENVRPGRKRALDDALFEFFRKEAIKSLKRDFAKFCNESVIFSKVYYLDSLDFGARILDQSVPRISVWNGNLIKFFSDLDHTKNNVFGKRHLRKNLPSCYLEVGMQDFSKCAKDASSICFEPVSFSLGFKKNSHLRFGSTLESKIIDGIIDSVQSAITAKHPNVSKAELCVTNVLDFLKNLKCSEPNLVSAEAAIHNCEHVIPKSAASLDGNMKISSEANSDIASKLGLINQQEFLQNVTSNAVENNLIDIFESPDGVMTKRAELCSVSTSPAMLPVRKVLSRFPHSVREDQYLLTSKTYPAGGNDSSAFLIHDSNNNSNDVHQSISFGGFVVDNNITSPISKINLSQAFVEKDVSAFLIPRGATVNKKRSRSSSISGSKEAPILVAETSPKALLNFPKVSNGSKNFRLRQVELATQSDDLYNKLINKAVQQDTHQPEINSQIDNNLDEYIDLSQNAAEERFPEDDTINNFVKLWKMIFKTYENIFRKFSVMYAKVPKQDNADDCGVFTMKFMEIFKPEVDTCSLFSKKDIIHIRIQFANQLYFCNRNNVDKSVVLNYKMQG